MVTVKSIILNCNVVQNLQERPSPVCQEDLRWKTGSTTAKKIIQVIVSDLRSWVGMKWFVIWDVFPSLAKCFTVMAPQDSFLFTWKFILHYRWTVFTDGTCKKRWTIVQERSTEKRLKVLNHRCNRPSSPGDLKRSWIIPPFYCACEKFPLTFSEVLP